jgi:Tfp pilus assembly protein PilF
MGRMTNDMCRLRGEIGSSHRARETFVKDLEKDVSEMQANFAFTRTARARRMKADLMAFTTRLRKEAGEMKADLTAFTTRLRKEAGERGRAVRTEMAGARHAWRGTRAFRAAG